MTPERQHEGYMRLHVHCYQVGCLLKAWLLSMLYGFLVAIVGFVLLLAESALQLHVASPVYFASTLALTTAIFLGAFRVFRPKSADGRAD